jgi:hypothetical protein
MVRDAALASAQLISRRRGNREPSLSSSRGSYGYSTRQGMPGTVPQPLPEG